MSLQYAECIEACYDCAAACDYCAASCLKEEDPGMMRDCIRLDMQCANLCRLAAQFMAMGSTWAKSVCQLCAEICEECGKTCRQHAMDHCQKCADACLRCAETCRAMA